MKALKATYIVKVEVIFKFWKYVILIQLWCQIVRVTFYFNSTKKRPCQKRPLAHLGLAMVDGMIDPLLLVVVSLLLLVSFLLFILKSLLSHKSLIFCTERSEFQQAPSVQIYQQGWVPFRCGRQFFKNISLLPSLKYMRK